MKRIITVVILSAAMTVPSAAQSVQTFENALGQVRGNVLRSREAQIKAKQTNLAAEISRAAVDVAGLEKDLRELEKIIGEVRARARRYPDSRLGDAAHRLAWDLRGFYTRADYLSAQIVRLRRFVRYADPVLLRPAKDLYTASQRMRARTEEMSRASGEAIGDLRRVGFALEADSIRQQTSDAVSAARDLETESWRLRAAVGK